MALPACFFVLCVNLTNFKIKLLTFWVFLGIIIIGISLRYGQVFLQPPQMVDYLFYKVSRLFLSSFPLQILIYRGEDS